MLMIVIGVEVEWGVAIVANVNMISMPQHLLLPVKSNGFVLANTRS